MIHDFEEIIIKESWQARNFGGIRLRFPRLSKVLSCIETLSTSAYAFAVAEEFLLLSVITFLSVEFGFYRLWTSVLIAFFIHLMVHLTQFIIFRRYIPAIITTLLGIFYSLYALNFISGIVCLKTIAPWAFTAVILTALNLCICILIASRFQKFLQSL